jgi:hypothetical protein
MKAITIIERTSQVVFARHNQTHMLFVKNRVTGQYHWFDASQHAHALDFYKRNLLDVNKVW